MAVSHVYAEKCAEYSARVRAMLKSGSSEEDVVTYTNRFFVKDNGNDYDFKLLTEFMNASVLALLGGGEWVSCGGFVHEDNVEHAIALCTELCTNKRLVLDMAFKDPNTCDLPVRLIHWGAKEFPLDNVYRPEDVCYALSGGERNVNQLTVMSLLAVATRFLVDDTRIYDLIELQNGALFFNETGHELPLFRSY